MVRSNKHLTKESHEESDFEKIYLQTLFGLNLSPGVLSKRLCRRLWLYYTHVRDNEGMGGRRGEEGNNN